MKRVTILILIALAFGCEHKPDANDQDKPNADTHGAAPAAEDEPTEGKFSVALKVSGSQEVFQMKDAPKPEAVQAHLKSAIEETPAFAPDGPRKLEGMVTYDIKALPDDKGYDVVLLGTLNSPHANFNAGVNVQSTDKGYVGQPLSGVVDGAVAEFARRIGAQARVIGGDNANLKTILENPDEPDSARLMAIQEIRERRATEHTEVVRKYLAPEYDVKLRLAAAATLVSMGDEKSRADILKVAEDFSRDRNPQFVPMLHILGDLGGPEVMTYLSAVADGHSAPAVREVAKEVLEKAQENEKKAP